MEDKEDQKRLVESVQCPTCSKMWLKRLDESNTQCKSCRKNGSVLLNE